MAKDFTHRSETNLTFLTNLIGRLDLNRFNAIKCKFYFAFLYLDRRFPLSHISELQGSKLRAFLPVVVETYKIRVNASMVGDTGLEPALTRNMGLNHTRLPIPPIPHIMPWLIFTRNSWLKPRATFYASFALSGFGEFFLTLGCPGGTRTHDILINSQAL